MESPESAEETAPINEQLAIARALLTMPRRQDPAWPALAAAAFFAVCALGFAFGAILAPPSTVTHLEDGKQ